MESCSPLSPSESLRMAHRQATLSAQGQRFILGKGVENEQNCAGVRSRAHGNLFWVAHSPLPAPPAEDKDQLRPHHGMGHPFQVFSCPIGATEAAESPPKLTAHLLTGITAGMATAPLGGLFKSPSASPLMP